MELHAILEAIGPWLGGGAVTVAAGVTVWLWMQYWRRDSDQRDVQGQIADDLREDRDYWRDMAKRRGSEVEKMEEMISELRLQNSELQKQNALLEAQNEILVKRYGLDDISDMEEV